MDLGSCICPLILEQLWWHVLMQTVFSQSTALMSILFPLVKKQGVDWALSVLEVITSPSQPRLQPAICFCLWPMCCHQGHHASPALINIQLDWGLAPVVWLWCIVLLSQSYGFTKQHPAIYSYVCVTPLSIGISWLSRTAVSTFWRCSCRMAAHCASGVFLHLEGLADFLPSVMGSF